MDKEYKPKKKYPSKKSEKFLERERNSHAKRWKPLESRLYSEFISQNAQIFECPTQRKEKKAYLMLSNFLKTRTPDQCRSHHLKMIKFHESIPQIVSHVRRTLEDTESNEINAQSNFGANFLEPHSTTDASGSDKAEQKEYSKPNDDLQSESKGATLETPTFEEKDNRQIWDVLDLSAELNLFCPEPFGQIF